MLLAYINDTNQHSSVRFGRGVKKKRTSVYYASENVDNSERPLPYELI